MITTYNTIYDETVLSDIDVLENTVLNVTECRSHKATAQMESSG